MNVVAAWRNRGRDLRGEYRRCTQCGRLAAVRRRSCTGCGADMREAAISPLPRALLALEASHDHVIVETMDQIASRGAAMLVQLGKDQLLALPLCASDAAHGPELVGEALEFALRRTNDGLGPRDPIAYGRRLAASAETRLSLKKKLSKEG
jgi:hypothetical protein